MAITDALIDAGYDVCGAAGNAADALALAIEHCPELAIIDVQLSGNRDGIGAAEDLAKLQRIGILYATANCGEVQWRATVGDGCLPKPFRVEWLVAALKLVELGTGDGAEPVPPSFFFVRR